jgi:hypothetical protein
MKNTFKHISKNANLPVIGTWFSNQAQYLSLGRRTSSLKGKDIETGD